MEESGTDPDNGENPTPKRGTECLEEALSNALKSVLGGTESEVDPRVTFYNKFRREVEEQDQDLKKYNEDLNTTLIFAGLFSAVASAFITDIQSELSPDYGQMNNALLEMLLNGTTGTLPAGSATSIPRWSGPDPAIVQVQCILFAALISSLLAAFIAMLGKQWLSRYKQNDTRGSALDRSRARERILTGLETWKFGAVMESLPLFLQFALLLFGFALSRYLWEVDRSVSSVVICFTYFGFLFYLIIVTALVFWSTPSPPLIRLAIALAVTHWRNLVSKSLLVSAILDLFRVLSPTALRFWKMGEDLAASTARRLGQIAVLTVQNLIRWSQRHGLRPLPVVSDGGFSYDHLRDILSSGNELESLYRLQSADAVTVINGLERGLREDSPLCTSDRQRFFVALKKMCYQHVRLPRSYVIADKLGWTGEHPIGGGGYADVWRGLYQGSQVAIKVLRVNQGADPIDLEKNFCREVVIWKQFKHPNLLPLLGTKKALRTLMVICEWMEHGTVVEFISAFPQANRLKLLADTARGLKYLHEWPYVHGGLKAGNILVDSSHTARIAGLGSAGLLPLNTPKESTYEWAAPELFSENSCLSKESDIYAFSMTVYEVLTGIRPFPHISRGAMPVLILAGERPSRPMNFDVLGLSEELWALAQQCWDRDPSNRPGITDVLVHFETASRDWVPPTLEAAFADLDVDSLKSQMSSMTESSDTTSADPE